MNNAGLSLFKSSTTVTEQDISSVMGTNFEASFHLSQLAYPLLKASESGSIVFISSVAGLTSLPFGTLYGASKGIKLKFKTSIFQFTSKFMRAQILYQFIDFS